MDDIAFAKSKLSDLGVTQANLSAPKCNNQLLGTTFITVFNESGAAVASPARAVADPEAITNDADFFTCRFRVSISVDDAKRYRAERPVGNFEIMADYPATVDYAFQDKSTLQSQNWEWHNYGGTPKR